MKLQLNNDKNEFEMFELNPGRYTIGSEETNNIHFVDETLSKKHAELLFSNDRIFIKDLKSKNGTYVMNQRIDSYKEIEIFYQDKVKMGEVTLDLVDIPVKTIRPSSQQSKKIDSSLKKNKKKSVKLDMLILFISLIIILFFVISSRL